MTLLEALSRREFTRDLATGAAAVGALALAPERIFAQGSATYDESISQIINIAATAEALAVTLTGAVIAGAAKYDGGKGLPPMVVTWVKGIQAEEYAHYQYLVAAGAKPLTTTFTVPQNLAGITNDSKMLLTFVVQAETVFIGAYIAAAQEFTEQGKPDLAKVAYQIAGVEAEHRTLANFALGAAPPNNLGFEKALFQNVAAAAAAVQGLGLLGTSNPAATLRFEDFKGGVDSTGVSQTTP